MIGRDTFSALAPVLGPQQKKLASSMSPSCTVHGGQHDTKHVAFEFLLHAAFVADEIRGNMLEPAHIGTGIVSVYPDNRVRCTVVPLYAPLAVCVLFTLRGRAGHFFCVLVVNSR